MKTSDILSYYCNTNTAFLHSHGEPATNLLLDRLYPQNFEKILEVGMGTGSTLVKIAAKNKRVDLFGVEKSEYMLKKTKQRLRLCGILNHIRLNKINEDGQYPFDNNFFDKIYCESVLAIQKNSELETTVAEIARVLKPRGLLVLNETIWLPSITFEEIEKINSYCKEKFGIIQANSKYKYSDEWCNLLESHNIHITGIEAISAPPKINSNEIKKIMEYRSKLFSLIGRIKGKFSSELAKEISGYKKNMQNIFEDKQYLQAMLFLGIKKVL